MTFLVEGIGVASLKLNVMPTYALVGATRLTARRGDPMRILCRVTGNACPPGTVVVNWDPALGRLQEGASECALPGGDYTIDLAWVLVPQVSDTTLEVSIDARAGRLFQRARLPVSVVT